MKIPLLLTIYLYSILQTWASNTYTISGRVTDAQSGTPIEFVTLYVRESGLWAVTGAQGTWAISGIEKGVAHITVQCLGYATQRREVVVKESMEHIDFRLKEDNLALGEVVITAQKKAEGGSTTYLIDRNTLNHAQLMNVADLGSLLPGGKSGGATDLASSTGQRISLLSRQSEMGNASFGTAVDVDGVRLENNSAVGETQGADVRNVSTQNIESVEIITGIPSVEYGDLSNGLVKIHTRKGKTPWTLELATQPRTKQIALSKGFALGHRSGTLNVGFERTLSTANLASPHTAYDRNVLTLNFRNTLFRTSTMPLSLQAGVTGNIGGYNSEADPDAFQDTYVHQRDNTLRAHLKLDWLLKKSWITNLEWSASAILSDKRQEEKTNKNSAAALPQIHSISEGYFIASRYDDNPEANIILSPTGYWYQTAVTDNQPRSYSTTLKARWNHQWKRINQRFLLGVEYTGSGNAGSGLYYDDLRTAPTWRPWRYDELPMLHNVAAYAEEKLQIKLSELSKIDLSLGLRHDATYISESEYGTAGSLSPRFNVRYTLWQHQDERWFSDLVFYGGIGKAVKLPSMEVLYPTPTYTDRVAFAPGSLADGTAFYAYHTSPSRALYNPDLKWQYTRQMEVGLETTLYGAKVSVSAFHNRTYNPYMRQMVYTPYTYKLTTQEHVEGCVIPLSDRTYSIDQATGIVTVGSLSGAYPAQQLAYKERNGYRTNSYYSNGSPLTRSGINWIIDFAPIHALRSSVRLDGSYYYYRGTNEQLIAAMPSNTTSMADGRPYQYVGYYPSNSGTSTATVGNGSLSRQVNLNLTLTTHVPRLRLITSLRLESTLLNYRENLSTRELSYSDEGYARVYPLYYSTWEEPDVRIPFAEKYEWAKTNDPVFYNELDKLVARASNAYYFRPNRVSAYFSANLNVTKEIGDWASVSFYATNFFNNMGRVKLSQTDQQQTLYNSSYIERFYYGLSVKIKL